VGRRHQQRQCLDGDSGWLSTGTYRAYRRRDDLACHRSADGSQPTFNLYASRITLPALVVWEGNDHCTFSPPAGSANLFSLIPSHHKARRALERAHSVATDPCGAFSEHGYAGIEEEAVREIAAFILRER
jgi:hypothetical protein